MGRLKLNIVIFEGPWVLGVLFEVGYGRKGFEVVYGRKGSESGFAVIGSRILLIGSFNLVLFGDLLNLLSF